VNREVECYSPSTMNTNKGNVEIYIPGSKGNLTNSQIFQRLDVYLEKLNAEGVSVPLTKVYALFVCLFVVQRFFRLPP
jgi:hypothetical protein